MAKDPWKKLMQNVKLCAQGRRGAPAQQIPKKLTLTIQDLKDQFEIQNRKCYWFDFELNKEHIFEVHHPLAMSVDRIDNSRGYEKDNFVVCCRFANLGRRNASEQQMNEVIKKLTLESKLDS